MNKYIVLSLYNIFVKYQQMIIQLEVIINLLKWTVNIIHGATIKCVP